MKKSILILIILHSYLIPLPTYSQYYNTTVEAKIIINKSTEFIEYKAIATNFSEIDQNLRYVFSVIKRGKDSGNTSKSSQNGRFILRPSEKKNLSKTILNLDQKSKTTLLLLVYNEKDILLGKDRIVINGKKKATLIAENLKKNDGILLKGIVTEDTKTKAGRDFYKLFDTDYRNNQINGIQIVSIKEKLSFGRNTIIEIWVGDKLVHQFYARPKNDYLKSMSKQSLYLVSRHFQTQEKRKKQIQLY